MRFIDAIRSALPKKVSEQLELVAEGQQRPPLGEALFTIVDSFMNDVTRQHVILTHEFKKALPYSESHRHLYAYELGTRVAGEGLLSVEEFVDKLEPTDFIRLNAKGPVVELTELGHRFAEWLVVESKKATYFESPFGQWGTLQPGGFIESRKRRASEVKGTQ